MASVATVYVGNLAADVTEADLLELFNAFGKVSSLRHLSGRGMAFVDLKPDAAAAAVDALRGTQLKGRTLDIALQQGRPGGGGRGRQRRRR
jgi:RNA recognition motif-containing protein